MRRMHTVLVSTVLGGLLSFSAAPAAFAGPAPAPPAKPAPAPRAPLRLGLVVVDITPELRTFFGAAMDRGLLIGRVAPGSPGEAAGVRVGDVLTSVGGRPVSGAPDVWAALADHKAGDKVDLQLVRDKQPVTLSATLRPEPASATRALERLPWLRGWLPWLDPDAPTTRDDTARAQM